MTESQRITDLNQKSLALTDAELSLVDKFSVLMPMSDLPEIVITSDKKNPSSSPASAEMEESIVSFQAANPDSKTGQPDEKKSEPVSISMAGNDETNDEPEDEETENDSAEDQESVLTVDFPQDELSIGKADADSGTADQQEESNEDVVDSEAIGADAIFNIDDQSVHADRLDKVADGIESGLIEGQSRLLALTAAESIQLQDQVFGSLLVALAKRNPKLKLIGIQGREPENIESRYSVGIGHVLSEEHLLEDVVIPTNIDNLDYLAFTEHDLSSAVYRNRIRRALDELKKHYDLVLVNCHQATSTETISLAEFVDSIYLIVKLVGSEREVVVAAVDHLRKKGARLAGCILADYQREAS